MALRRMTTVKEQMTEEIIDIAAQQEADRIIELQSKLCEMTNDDVKPTMSFILQNKFADDIHRFRHLVQNIIIVSKIRPTQAPVLVELVHSMIDSIDTDNCLDKTVELLLSWMEIYLCVDKHSVMEQTGLLHFLRMLVTRLVVYFDVVFVWINAFYEKHRISHPASIVLIFAYFIFDIHSKDAACYDKFVRYVRAKGTSNDFPRPLFDWICSIRVIQNDDWQKWHNYINRIEDEDPIMQIIRKDDVDKLKGIVQDNRRFDLNKRIKPSVYEHHYFLQSEPTLIQVACYFGSLKVFEYLKAKKVDFLLQDKKGRTVVQFATAGWNPFLISFLDKMELTCIGLMPISAEFFIPEFFNYIQNYNKDQNQITSLVKTGYESFHRAALCNNFAVLKLYISNDVDINVVEDKNQSALHKAATGFNFAAIEYILSIHGVNPNIKDKSWNAPIHIAAMNRDLESVRALCQAPNIDVNIKDSIRRTPLHLAVYNDDVPMVEYLMSLENVDVNAKDMSGMVPLHWAIETNDLDLINLFLNHPKVDLKAEDDNESSVRDYIVRSRNKEIGLAYCKVTGDDIDSIFPPPRPRTPVVPMYEEDGSEFSEEETEEEEEAEWEESEPETEGNTVAETNNEESERNAEKTESQENVTEPQEKAEESQENIEKTADPQEKTEEAAELQEEADKAAESQEITEESQENTEESQENTEEPQEADKAAEPQEDTEESQENTEEPQEETEEAEESQGKTEEPQEEAASQEKTEEPQEDTEEPQEEADKAAEPQEDTEEPQEEADKAAEPQEDTELQEEAA